MKQYVVERGANDFPVAEGFSEYIDMRVLAANVVEEHAIPSGAKFVVITSDADFWLKGYSLGTEVLDETDFATHANWDVTGDWDDSGGNAAYTDSTNAGTLTQVNEDMASGTLPIIARWYRFKYTVSSPSGDPASVIEGAAGYMASEDITLPHGTARDEIVIFKSSGVVDDDFRITTTSSSGGVTIDDVSLKLMAGAPIGTATSLNITVPAADISNGSGMELVIADLPIIKSVKDATHLAMIAGGAANITLQFYG